MSTYTITASSTRKTLTANSEDVVILDAAYPRVVIIADRNNTADLVFKRTSGSADQNDTAITAMNQDGTMPVAPGATWDIGDDQISINPAGGYGSPPTKVRLYSTAAGSYWVIGYAG